MKVIQTGKTQSNAEESSMPREINTKNIWQNDRPFFKMLKAFVIAMCLPSLTWLSRKMYA
ncbi:MAG TPA: hypothetical protein VKT28_05635 [Puia sp.]|nr:hypothetical protein [Puia sp.]